MAGTLALGHNSPVQNEAAIEFLKSSALAQGLDMASPVKDEFVTTLFSTFPKEFADRAKVQFCGPAGTDVTEAAVKLAQIATGNETVVSFAGGYHGHTIGALSLMGNVDVKSRVPNLRSGVHFAPYPYDYRCPLGMGGEDGAATLAYQFEHMLDDPESGLKKPACVILEVIQGEGGVVDAPASWLREIRRITAERGIVMIVDEVQTGVARTGHMYAHQFAGIQPDAVCLSKVGAFFFFFFLERC